MGKLKNEKTQKVKRVGNSTPKNNNPEPTSPNKTSDSDILNSTGSPDVSISRKSSVNSVYLCGSCNEAVVGELSVSCEICHAWFHYACVNIPSDQAEFVNSPQIHWFCAQCNTSAQELIAQLQDLTVKQQELKSDLTVLVNNAKAEAVTEATKKAETKISELESEMTVLVNNAEAEAVTEAKKQAETKFSELEADLENRIYTKVLEKVKTENKQELEEVKKSYAVAAAPSEQQITTMKTELKNEVIAYTQNLPATTNKEQVFELFNEHSAERERIKARAANLILHNLPESRSVDDDIAKTRQIIKEVLKIADFQITKATRLGFYDQNKDRLFRITLEDVATKKKILSRATMLRDLEEDHMFASVYIRPDMTPKQVETSKNLQSLLRETRLQNQGTGKTFKISRGKIIETTPQQPATPDNDHQLIQQ